MKQITIEYGTDQFTFYDNQDGIILREFDGFEYPEARALIDDISGKAGFVFLGSRFSKRIFSFTGDFVGDNVFSDRRDMLDPLEVGELKTVKFTTYDDLELQCEAELREIDNPYNHSVNTFRIELVAPDWRFYSQTLNDHEMEITSITGGAEIPAEIPMSIWSDVDLGNVIENAGNEKTPPVFKIKGPGSSFIIRNQTTGEVFEIDETLALGEEIEVDIINRTVMEGATSVKGSFSGDWLELCPGENEFGFTGSGTDDNTALVIEWRDAYNGI